MPNTWKAESETAKSVRLAGFTYDPENDIIYSRMNAWQRNFGYAYGYDLAAPVTISAVIDCEPFFFRYGDKEWMIELWKGQYGLETGGEIGIYTCTKEYPPLDSTLGRRPHDPANSRFFECAGKRERLMMSFQLKRKGRTLFSRGPELHWWLTGFRWGELSEPEDLVMDLSITFPIKEMRTAFIDAVSAAGYEDIYVTGEVVSFTFDKPKTFQPRKDPDCRTFVETADSANKKIVSEYKELNLPDNDPNSVQGEVSEKLISYFNTLRPDRFEKYLVTVLKASGLNAKDIIPVLMKVFSLGRNEAGAILDKAGFSSDEISDAFKRAVEDGIKPGSKLLRWFKKVLKSIF